MKQLPAFLFGVVLTALVAVVVGFVVGVFGDRSVDIPWTLLATVAVGVACLGWLVVVVVLPWNLHFQARHLLHDIERSRARGIVVADVQEQRARRVSRRMLGLSLVLHAVSAALLGVGAWLYAQPIGFVFSGLFVLSTLFRPGVEAYRHVRSLLTEAALEVRYPRDDVMKVVDDVRGLLMTVEQQGAQVHELQRESTRTRAELVARSDEHQKKLDGVARRFEETLDRLTDNQEIISGIKAFLRLVQQPGPLPPG